MEGAEFGGLEPKGTLAPRSLTLEKCLTQCRNSLMTQVPLTGGETEAQRADGTGFRHQRWQELGVPRSMLGPMTDHIGWLSAASLTPSASVSLCLSVSDSAFISLSLPRPRCLLRPLTP